MMKSEYSAKKAEWTRKAKAYEQANPDMYIHVTAHDAHKLAGMQSISTSVRINPICRARIQHAIDAHDDTCICLSCYADTQLAAYRTLERCCHHNYDVLTNRVLSADDIARLPIFSDTVRIESMGDCANRTQALNYTNIMNSWAGQRFGVWTKNPGFYADTWDRTGKPKNCSFVFSGDHVDQIPVIPTRAEKYIDHVFVCVSSEDMRSKLMTAYPESVACKCDTGSCKRCMACYTKNPNNYYIFEIVRNPKTAAHRAVLKY